MLSPFCHTVVQSVSPDTLYFVYLYEAKSGGRPGLETRLLYFCIHTCMHASIHASMHPYIHTSIHPYHMHLLLGGQHCLDLHLVKELEKWLQCQRWRSSQELGSHRIRTTCFIREMLKHPCQLSHGQWFKLLCLLLGLLTNAGSCGWFVCLICHSCPQPCSRCVILSSRCF